MNSTQNPNLTVSCNASPGSPGIGVATYFVILILISLVGNSMVCIAIFVHKSLRTATNVLVASLAMSDIGVSITIMPFRILEELNTCLSREVCITFMVLDIVVSTSSVMTLLAIAVERAIAVKVPGLYTMGRFCNKAIAVCVLIWSYGIMSAVFAPFSWDTSLKNISVFSIQGKCINKNYNYIKWLYSMNFFLPLLVISAVYLCLFCILRKRMLTFRSSQYGRRRRRELGDVEDTIFDRRLHKATKTLVSIYVCFLVCWLPNGVIVMIHATSQSAFRTIYRYSSVLYFIIYYTCSIILPPLNSVLNPFIYGMYHTGVKKAVFEILFDTRSRQKNVTLLHLENNNNDHRLQVLTHRRKHLLPQSRPSPATALTVPEIVETAL